jgi:hypothetical protein
LKKGHPPVVITVPIPTGAPNSASFQKLSGIRTFKVWTNPLELNGKLQNDLDLVVVVPNGQERYGNTGTAKGSDSINNVEQVVWENIPAVMRRSLYGPLLSGWDLSLLRMPGASLGKESVVGD